MKPKNDTAMSAMQELIECPFCEGDIDGCCFCDHSGRISVGGENDFFKSENDVKQNKGIEFLKEHDKQGGIEIWPEMIEYFLNK